MTTHRILAAVLAGLLAAPAWADDAPAKADPNADARADALALLPQANELAAVGREVKSAETLVIAGGMLLRANSLFGGKTDPLTEQPAEAKDQPAAAVPLTKQAEALFDEARALAAGSADKGRLSAVEALIKTVSAEFPKRGSIGGPKTTTRTLNPGETHKFNFRFVSGQTAAVAMTSPGPGRLQFDVLNQSGGTLFSLKGQNASYTWVPVRDPKGYKDIDVVIHNPSKKTVTYTLAKN